MRRLALFLDETWNDINGDTDVWRFGFTEWARRLNLEPAHRATAIDAQTGQPV